MSPTPEPYDMEKAILETTPLRHEEEKESETLASTKNGRNHEAISDSLVNEDGSSSNKDKEVDNIDLQNTRSSPTNRGNSDDIEKTVIEQTPSSQISQKDECTESQSPEQESAKTKVTSIRTETEKAKARFLESDI